VQKLHDWQHFIRFQGTRTDLSYLQRSLDELILGQLTEFGSIFRKYDRHIDDWLQLELGNGQL
jgi:hypothetical protein